MKFEIVKRNHNFLLIYTGIGLISFSLGIVLFINTNGVNGEFGNMEYILLGIIVLLLLAAFKIIPNLPIAKHTKRGYIHYNHDHILIEDTSGNREVNLCKINTLTIKLFGHDGQHRLGNINSLGKGNASAYPNIRPLDGLNNFIRFNSKNIELKYEFYIHSDLQYNELKQLLNNWEKFENFQIKIVR